MNDVIFYGVTKDGGLVDGSFSHEMYDTQAFLDRMGSDGMVARGVIEPLLLIESPARRAEFMRQVAHLLPRDYR